MSNLEHYFENLLFDGEDVKGEYNKKSLSKEQQEAVEECAQYVICDIFGHREIFKRWMNGEYARCEEDE